MASFPNQQKGTARRVVIVGGVAAGATAAARARRLDERAAITLIERGPYVSYANCGLPYFLSGEITDREALLLQTPEGFQRRYGVEVQVNTEVISLDRQAKRVLVRGPEGETWIPYDTLILAQGAQPVLPALPGSASTHVFKLWTVPDMDRLDAFIASRQPRSAVVVGGGFIGIEMAEAFRKRGLSLTLVELQPSVLAVMDREFGRLVQAELEANGVHVLTGVGIQEVKADHVVLSDGQEVPADVVLFSVGVRPELAIAKASGLEVGASGGLVVDEYLRTSDPEIYAAGDMVEVRHRVSGRFTRIPLAGPANRQGRIAASNALGLPMRYGGALATSVVKVFEATAAMTGLSERAAREAGCDVGVAVLHKEHHASYYPGAEEMALKLVYDRRSARLLGAQAFGRAGVEKRIDVLATALRGEFTLEELADLDLAYAPPYSSANDPVNLAAFIGLNDLSGYSPLVTAEALAEELASSDPFVLDVRREDEFLSGHLEGAHHVPLDALRDRMSEIPRDRRVVVYCRAGYRGHLAARILQQHGYENVANVTGGYLSMRLEPRLAITAATAVV